MFLRFISKFIVQSIARGLQQRIIRYSCIKFVIISIELFVFIALYKYIVVFMIGNQVWFISIFQIGLFTWIVFISAAYQVPVT